jgi:hypothetical protein
VRGCEEHRQREKQNRHDDHGQTEREKEQAVLLPDEDQGQSEEASDGDKHQKLIELVVP